MNRQAKRLRRMNHAHGFKARDMHDQQGHIHERGQRNGAIGGFGLSQRSVSHRVVLGGCQTALDQALGNPADHVIVFGVYHH